MMRTESQTTTVVACLRGFASLAGLSRPCIVEVRRRRPDIIDGLMFCYSYDKQVKR